jgi:hypothetical protein
MIYASSRRSAEALAEQEAGLKLAKKVRTLSFPKLVDENLRLLTRLFSLKQQTQAKLRLRRLQKSLQSNKSRKVDSQSQNDRAGGR